MGSLEKSTKSILKSLTLSSAKGLTVQDLCRDYREMIGTSIPFQKLGYSDLMGFLKSIPDTIIISGSGMSALVIPVTDEKTAHLEAMIQKQKKPSSSRRRSSRRTIQRPRAIRIQSSNNENTRGNFDADQNSFSKANISHEEENWDGFSSDDSQNINHAIPTKNESYSFSKPNILPVEQIKEKLYNMNDISSDESHSIVNHMKSTKSDFYSASIQNGIKSRVRAINNSNNDFAASTISRKFTDPFKDKLRQLISAYPNGIWCSELPQYYKKHFNENLNVSDKGYCSVIHFCTSHSDIFHCVKPNKGDWMIFDAQHPNPNYEKYNTNDHSFVEEASIDDKKDNALPELDLSDILNFSNQNIEVMPDDILQFGEKIPRQWLQIPDDGYITVRVTEVYDPSKFWIQLYSEDCSAALDQLMNDMQDFYVMNDVYNIPTSDVQVGLYCVALIYNEWHRGMIVKIEDPYVKIFYFDYGSIAKTNKNSLKYLHRKFSILPRQAIRARLANIRPRYPAVMWSHKATKFLLNLINDRVLVAEVLNSVEIQYHTLHVILTDTNDPNKDVHINDELKRQGFAELLADVCKVNTYNRNHPIKKVHYFLYPNHEDIENGIVPTIDEVAIMTNNGISMEMIFKPYINLIDLESKKASTKNKSYQLDFHVCKNNDITDMEEVDSCLEIDEILPETEYDSDGCSSIVTVDTVQTDSLYSKTLIMETQVNDAKTIDIPTVKQPIKEKLEPIDELTSMKVEEVINKPSNSLNITTNFKHDTINVQIRPPPGFQIPKPVIPPLNPYTIQNPYYNSYSPYPVPLPPAHTAQLVHSLMMYGAGAAAAAQSVYQSQLYQNMYLNPYQLSNIPRSPEFVPNNTLPVNSLNLITQQTDNLSLQNNEEPLSIKVKKLQTVLEDLKDDLKTIIKMKENNNTEEIRLLEAQTNEIIRSIIADNVITSLAENIIKLNKSQIYKLKEMQVLKDSEVCKQELRDILRQNNQSINENREKQTDASIQVDVNYEINKLNSKIIESEKNNCDVEKIKKIVNVEKMCKDNDRQKTCKEKVIEELNIAKDQSISKDNLCKKVEPKTSVEFKEFAQKKVTVIKINGECYLTTLDFLLSYTAFPTIERVKSVFSNLNIDFPSIQFDVEAHSKHSYKKLLKHNVPGCFPKNPIIELVNFKDVPALLEKLFATNPALVKDLQNYTNQNMCK